MARELQFSLFGIYNKFNTGNTENYLEAIKYFSSKKFRPSTMNELQIGPDGNSMINIMPLFIFEKNYIIEILSNRINFKYQNNDNLSFENCNRRFTDVFINILSDFSGRFDLETSRIALNYDAESKYEEEVKCAFISSYFNDKPIIQNIQKNATLIEVNNEKCNILFERMLFFPTQIVKYSYDINTIAENDNVRFRQELDGFYNEFKKIVINIGEGLN